MKKELLKSKTSSMQLFVSEYTIRELANNVEVPSGSLTNEEHWWHHSRTLSFNRNWFGGIGSISEAKGILENGWPEGSAKILKLQEQIEEIPENLPKVKNRRRRQCWANDGETLDIDRAMVGQWDSAYRSTYREMVDGNQKCVTLVCGWGGNFVCSAEDLFWSGAVMLVLSDILEKSGYSVKLVAASKICHYFYNYSLTRVMIKDHGEPLQIDGLAGILCHASAFRIFGFRALVFCPWDITPKFGRATTWEEIAEPMISCGYQDSEPNSIIVNDCYSEQSAIKEIQRVLTQFA